MPRLEATIEVIDAEKRDFTTLIQAGKPLPEKYRFALFEDKREVELVWNGKTRDVCTWGAWRRQLHFDDLCGWLILLRDLLAEDGVVCVHCDGLTPVSAG